MSKNLFITSTEARSGKTTVSLGIMEMLSRHFERIAFFRPIINIDPLKGKPDNDLQLFASYFKLDMSYDQMYVYTSVEASNLLAMGKLEELLDGILTQYDRDFPHPGHCPWIGSHT